MMWPRGHGPPYGGGGGSSKRTSVVRLNNNNAPHSAFDIPSSSGNDDTSSYAKLYTTTNAKTTKTKKKTRNTNAHNNNTSTKTLTIGLVLLALTAMRVFWSHRNAHDREGHPSSARVSAPGGVSVGGDFVVVDDDDDFEHNTNSHRKSSLWSRGTNNAPRGSRVSSQQVAANLVVDHLGRALAPMISKYVDLNEDGAVDADELERFADRVGGVENVGKGFTSAVLAALTTTWGDAESGGQHNRPIEKTPCALEFNRALSTGAELEVTSDVQFKGVKPFCVEAWVKPSDAETARNGFQGYGGAIFAKKMSDEIHPDDDETDVLLMDEAGKGKNVGRGQFTFALDDAGGLTFMRETGLTSALRSKRHLKPNTYTHVAASYGFGDASIFINGTLDATRKEGAILRGDDVAPLTIGMLLDRKGRSRLGFTGTIQEVRLWNRPCDKESMKRYYERRLVGWEPGLTAYWPMNDCFGKIIAEKRGEHRGRVTGRAAWRRNGHHLMTDDDIELCKHLAKGVIDESLA